MRPQVRYQMVWTMLNFKQVIRPFKLSAASSCEDSFGQEAVDTLIKEMEDKRNLATS